MAKQTNVSSNFRIVAIAAAVMLLLAAALAYFQSGSGGSANAELAALSQAIPGQAQAALNGGNGGFDQLDTSVKRLAELRRGAGPALPGSSGQWQQLESQAGSILDAVIATSTGAMQSLNFFRNTSRWRRACT